MDLSQNIYSEDEEDQEIEKPSATPLWKYVTKVPGEKKAGGGGSGKFLRVKPGEKKASVNLCPKVIQDNGSSPGMKKTIANIFQTNDRKDVDQRVARFFYGNGIPFNVARSPFWTDMVPGINNAPKGYKAPNYEKITNYFVGQRTKAVFVNGHDVSGIEKTGLNIAEFIFKAINFVEPSNVVQSSDPSLSFFNGSYNKGKAVVKYIKNHGSCQFLYKTFSDLELLKTKKTRFGHVFIVMQRLVTVRSSLVAMALSNHWETLRRSSSDPNQYDTVKKIAMDEDFWSKTIYKMLRFCDTDQAIIGEVYEQMDTMLGKLKDILVTDPVVYNLVHQIVVERWDTMNIPLHCLAYVLVPKYYTHSWLSKPAPGGVRRMKPHCDLEVQKGYLDAINKMIIDPSEATKTRHQISDFVSDKGVFAQPQAIKDRATMQTLSRWHMYGGPAPELYSLALRVLSQGVYTSCAERCWSTYSYIHNVKRNRLNCSCTIIIGYYRGTELIMSRSKIGMCLMEMQTLKNLCRQWGRENVILSDGDDDAVQAVITPTSTAPGSSSTSVAATSSTLPPSALIEKTLAQMRLEKARGKRQKK
ncbi:hypothetical protein RHSIM_Rhsim04G0118200 [Rhododendron simsii]|uniref:HAT C-terminal dimerisation domain-containing protein n=1 Tax=Rhododendron simsii TaxID=118357 RepID=A0A834H0S1_RHOSS|nr:hypothetical protein RHSIM_Rhsim04G0118200 [Rhododendron simsii]